MQERVGRAGYKPTPRGSKQIVPGCAQCGSFRQRTKYACCERLVYRRDSCCVGGFFQNPLSRPSSYIRNQCPSLRPRASAIPSCADSFFSYSASSGAVILTVACVFTVRVLEKPAYMNRQVRRAPSIRRTQVLTPRWRRDRRK